MLNGDNASFSVVDGVVSIEGATVTTPDVIASNGVIHIIDKVLMPPADVEEPANDIPAIASGTGTYRSGDAIIKQDYYTLYKVKDHTLSSHLLTKRSLMPELALTTSQVKKAQQR